MRSVNIIWLKKDLRLEDNESLIAAAQDGLPVIIIYCFEKSLWKEEDASYRHFLFIKQSLDDLQQSCNRYNFHLNIFVEEVLDVFAQLSLIYDIKNIFSNQETGNYASFRRDKNVKNWCKLKNIAWIESIQNGVIRALEDRDGWSVKWYRKMSAKIFNVPNSLFTLKISNDSSPNPDILGLKYDGILSGQVGGRESGLRMLRQFLYQRGEDYSKKMSSPVTAFESCSRISPYLTYGCLSIKEVFQSALVRQEEINMLPKEQKGKWPSALRSFLGRLRWHCHFIQKLEDEPEIEFQNLHRAYDQIDRGFNEKYYRAWAEGQTGFPMIDSCMRALIESGWINFRMRAMLVSFASNHLWLDWKVTSKHLARLFVDYEPGIHYSQIQMQSGTTGINAIRIYSPTKQAIDQDPKGVFIRKYIPELKDISNKNIATPSKEPLLMNGYPFPIIDEVEQRKLAAQKLYSLRKNPEYKISSKKILKKHGSRKSGLVKNTKSF